MIRGEGDWKADRLERALEEIRSLLPAPTSTDTSDPYDGSANPAILKIIERELGMKGKSYEARRSFLS